MSTPPDESKIFIYLGIALLISIGGIFLSKKSKTKLGARYAFIDYSIMAVMTSIMLLTQIYFYYKSGFGSDVGDTVLLFQLTFISLFHGIFNIKYKNIIQDNFAYKSGIMGFGGGVILMVFLVVWHFTWGF